MTTRIKASQETTKKGKEKKVMKKPVRIVSRMERTTLLKFYKTTAKKKLELDYNGIEVHISTPQRPTLQA